MNKKQLTQAIEQIQQALSERLGDGAAVEIKPEGVSLYGDDGSVWESDAPAATVLNHLSILK